MITRPSALTKKNIIFFLKIKNKKKIRRKTVWVIFPLVSPFLGLWYVAIIVNSYYQLQSCGMAVSSAFLNSDQNHQWALNKFLAGEEKKKLYKTCSYLVKVPILIATCTSSASVGSSKTDDTFNTCCPMHNHFNKSNCWQSCFQNPD